MDFRRSFLCFLAIETLTRLLFLSTGDKSCVSDVSTAVKNASGPIMISSAPSANIVAAEAQFAGTSRVNFSHEFRKIFTILSAAMPFPPSDEMQKYRCFTRSFRAKSSYIATASLLQMFPPEPL